jgi:DNA (cytosine-5)-methyltransferase 3A
MKKLNVLSLFDGMSCGMIALDNLGIACNYYASEVDKYAIKVSQDNYPGIIRVGDVTKLSYKDGVLTSEFGSYNVGAIDLLIGGSPCQSLSNLGDGTGLSGKSSLFYHWLRLKNEIQPKNFLLENVGMKTQWQEEISKLVSVQPIVINSRLVSAQNRKRLYWTSLLVNQPDDLVITLKDIVTHPVDAKYYLSNKAKVYITSKDRLKKKLTDLGTDKAICLPARYTALNGTFICVDNNGKIDVDKAGTLTARYAKGVATFGGDTYVYDAEDVTKELIRKFTPEECETLQTVPNGYTKCVSDSQRYKMLGNGWTVKVIEHILKGLKENTNGSYQ